jgi:glycosyltransferase involved in cell wall biosynthesis/predicted SAM-dependent methyltransferase
MHNKTHGLYQPKIDNRVNKFYFSNEYLPNRKSGIPIQTRLKKRPVLLAIPELCGGKPSPCSYIRLLMPLMSHGIQSQFEVRFASLKSAFSVPADVVLINRVPCEDASELKEFLTHLRQSHAKLIYDIDDQLLELPLDHPEADIYKNRQAVVLRLLSEADLTCTSTALLSKAFNHLYKQNAVYENYVSLQTRESGSDYCQPRDSTNKKFNILYMGTMTHGADLNLVLGALRKLYSEGKEFELYLIGITETVPEHDWIKVIHPPASANSYPKFMRWLRNLHVFDLGIAPLESTPFNRCKSAIKYWDYTSLGIPTLASNVEAYSNIIADGDGGYLTCNNPGAWYDKLNYIINNKEQLPSVAAYAMRALEKIHANLNGEERRIKEVFELLDKPKPSSELASNMSNANSTPISRELIASAFLCGDGIEIGALHNPLAIPKHAQVKYVDRLPKDKLYEHYPELRIYSLVDVDIVDDGEYLNRVMDESQDFVIANHFLEHSEDPITTITNLLRVTKVGGVVYLAIPNMTQTFDCNREQTKLQHLIDDHELGVEESRRLHYEEWVSLVEPHFGRTYEQPALNERIEELMRQRYSIHFHCWNAEGFQEVLLYLKNDYKLPFDISLFVEREDEYVAILTKISSMN